MQAGSPEFPRLRAEADIDPLCIHVPGLALVAEGIDSSSRAESSLWMDFGDNSYLDSVVRPSVPDKPWGKIVTAAQSAGLRATLDPCATESTPRAERYCSRYWEPGSEAMDAFLVRNRAQSRCSSWGAIHRTCVRLPFKQSHQNRRAEGRRRRSIVYSPGASGGHSALLARAGRAAPKARHRHAIRGPRCALCSSL